MRYGAAKHFRRSSKNWTKKTKAVKRDRASDHIAEKCEDSIILILIYFSGCAKLLLYFQESEVDKMTRTMKLLYDAVLSSR